MMDKLTNKWQCSKCKQTKEITVRTKIIKVNKEKRKTIHPNDIPKIKCCCRVMRNLTNEIYDKEVKINKSGLRDKNK